MGLRVAASVGIGIGTTTLIQAPQYFNELKLITFMKETISTAQILMLCHQYSALKGQEDTEI